MFCTLIQTFITLHWFYRGYILKFKNPTQYSDKAALISSFASNIVKGNETSNIEVSKISKTANVTLTHNNHSSHETPTYVHTMQTPVTLRTSPLYSISYPWDPHYITKLHTIMALISSCLWCWIYGIITFLLKTINRDFVDKHAGTMVESSYLFIFIMITGLYTHLYYLDRLFEAFKNTIWELKRYQYLITKLLLIISSVFGALFFMITEMFDNEFRNIETNIHSNVRWFIVIITHIIWDIILLYMFLRRLILLKYEIVTTKRFENRFTRFYKIITCFTISIIISCTSTVSTLFTFTINDDFGKMCVFIDIVINSICLIFTYGKYIHIYRFCCCVCRFCFE